MYNIQFFIADIVSVYFIYKAFYLLGFLQPKDRFYGYIVLGGKEGNF